jgi:hypothetical protein
MNKINEHTPPTPQTEGEEETSQPKQKEPEEIKEPEPREKEPEPMTQRGEEEPEAKPEAKTLPETPKPSPEYDLFEAIRRVYNSTLPELTQAERITAFRTKVLRQRIRESSERKELSWWEKFFSRVRNFPWPMGQNKNRWRADFDWLIEERGMQKILEGAFQKAPANGGGVLRGLELQKKYTDSEGRVDGLAILREIRRTSAHRQSFF